MIVIILTDVIVILACCLSDFVIIFKCLLPLANKDYIHGVS